MAAALRPLPASLVTIRVELRTRSLYPRVMDGKRAAPGGPGDDEPPPPEASAEHAGWEDELYGPLELERLRKDDGRALIVFSRVDGRR